MISNDKLQKLNKAGYSLVQRTYLTYKDQVITQLNDDFSVRNAIYYDQYTPAQSPSKIQDCRAIQYLLVRQKTGQVIPFFDDELDRLEKAIDFTIDALL